MDDVRSPGQDPLSSEPGKFRALARGSVRDLVKGKRDFRVLLGSQFLGQAADGFAQAALANVLILEPQGQDTAGRLLAVFALTLLPYAVIAPFLGVFIDRWQRRGLLVVANVIRAAILLTFPLWSTPFEGEAPLFVVALLLLGFGRLFLTTKGAVLPFVLHEHDLLQGNSVSGGGGMISAILGGVVGIAAAGPLGTDALLVIGGVMYVGSSWVATRLSDPMAHPAAHALRLGEALARVARELIDGLKEVWRRPRARLPLAGIFVLRSAGMMTAIAAILVIKTKFPDAGQDLGRLSSSALALGTAGAGALAGAAIVPRLGRRFNEPRLVMLGFIIVGVMIVALGGIENLVAVLTLTFVGGMGGFIAKISTDAMVQAALPDEYRGRAFALYDILYNSASVAAAGLIVAFDFVSLRTLMILAGVWCLLLAGGLALAMRRAGLFADH